MRAVVDRTIAPLTTLGLGGEASEIVEASTDEDIVSCLRCWGRQSRPGVLLAGGSNVVVADAPGDTAVMLLRTRGLELRRSGDSTAVEVEAAAGESLQDVVDACLDAGLAGVECLSGIPGSVGATPMQNVGAYGQEIADVVSSVKVYDRELDTVYRMTRSDCRFGHRSSAFRGSSRWAVLAVTLCLQRSRLSDPLRYAQLAQHLGTALGDRMPLADVASAVVSLRRSKGMVLDPADPDTRSVGSFFTNPVVGAGQRERLLAAAPGVPLFGIGPGRWKASAAWLIEQAGFGRGYGPGPVRISTKHTLALTHPGGGSTEMLVALAREIRDGVLATYGILLEPEPVLIGVEL
ncbi:MAG: UDP-N-acetylmuramate dehydrogenase [Actinomycetota bacterium]|nr:UDP-N-acetylmuramate dehydrogenase [Actinomycetota bacterium]